MTIPILQETDSWSESWAPLPPKSTWLHQFYVWKHIRRVHIPHSQTSSYIRLFSVEVNVREFEVLTVETTKISLTGCDNCALKMDAACSSETSVKFTGLHGFASQTTVVFEVNSVSNNSVWTVAKMLPVPRQGAVAPVAVTQRFSCWCNIQLRLGSSRLTFARFPSELGYSFNFAL
jgi:hypothetical protein